MSNSIVVDPQSVEQGATPQAKSPEPADPLAFVIPKDFDKVDPTYRGKSLADIIEMQQNATRKIGEQANEIGTWRNLVTQMSEANAGALKSAEGTKPAKPKLEITSERLLDDPAGSIADAIESVLESKLAPLAERLNRNETLTELQRFERDFPEASKMGQDPEFLSWGSQSPTRLRKMQRASQGDLEAARDLLENWQERQQLLTQFNKSDEKEAVSLSSKPQGVEGARKAATEPGGTGAASQALYSTADLINMINTNPDKYRSPSFQAELQKAAKEGRIVA